MAKMEASVGTLTVKEQVAQLNQARKIVLDNPAYYPEIVKGVLPIISPTSLIELRRWGADFLAESLASPALSASDRETMTVSVLETLQGQLENPNEDALVLKSCVIAAASAYPVVLNWITRHSDQLTAPEAWRQMLAIKSRVLRIWDDAVVPVKICCIKFAQRVVLAQTQSNGVEAKNALEVSLSSISPGHSLLEPRQLEAEATGLLDRMLGVLQDNSSDALLVDATLNTLSVLARTRPGTANRVLNVLMNFNPLKLANSPLTPTTKVLIKSMEKTTRTLLLHLAKRDRDPNSLVAGKLQQTAEKWARQRAEVLDEGSRKRALPGQSLNDYASTKRARLETGTVVVPRIEVKPLPPGPKSLASIFTLTNNRDLQAFDATLIPAPLASKISIAVLATVDPQLFEQALGAIRDRLASIYAESGAQAAAINPDTAPLGVDDDDDDYEPDFYPAEDSEQILNKLDASAHEEEPVEATKAPTSALAPLGPFRLGSPPSLSPDAAAKVGQLAILRVFGPLSSFEDESAVHHTRAGLNRLAASSNDRDAWVTVIIRLATRSNFGLEDPDNKIKMEETNTDPQRPRQSIPDMLRELLYNYIMEDFRRRIEVAMDWLCEEWYNDQLARRYGISAPLHYELWALRLIDGFSSYLTPQDKVFTRFLAEIPELTKAMLDRVKALCSDPTLVQLALTSLLYLVMMKPPTKELALDTVGDIWHEVDTARPMAAKYLNKYRPGFVESQQPKLEETSTES